MAFDAYRESLRVTDVEGPSSEITRPGDASESATVTTTITGAQDFSEETSQNVAFGKRSRTTAAEALLEGHGEAPECN